ncbi:serine/threonine-protein kinase 19-like isoform X1 [Schistocerca cancellata]|uniref:serine/threonine-protein kinase 19-like isoform X1 n=1 Tax=Schistocerca cancellata TaxID=274614 RepID=UPI0021191EA1|nr:serine/threonine-protein kinase 19-like isoform X1 [Schistocerca cancellata]
MKRRVTLPDFYIQRKKPHLSVDIQLTDSDPKTDTNFGKDAPSDTECALVYLRSKFPNEAFEGHLPPVIVIHQVYAIVKCKTTVDKDVSVLQSKGKIRIFKLGGEESALVAIFTEDLKKHVLKWCAEKPIITRFLNDVLPEMDDVSIDKSVLQKKFTLSEHDIRFLFGCGLLTLRSASSFWFSFPNAGDFMKTYLKGRKAVLATIKRSKFSEILQPELEQRKLKKSEKFGMVFYIYDIIGADLVECIETTSGNLLRLRKKK